MLSAPQPCRQRMQKEGSVLHEPLPQTVEKLLRKSLGVPDPRARLRREAWNETDLTTVKHPKFTQQTSQLHRGVRRSSAQTADMGWGDPRQKQLSFDTNKNPKTTPVEGPSSASSKWGVTPPPDGTAAIMAKLRAGFQAIDSFFDAMGSRLSRMNERINLQATRMDGTERRISKVEDGSIDTKKCLERELNTF
ncbi:hypothetical protein NDU88_004237 [Pleurodeles waltl]|uniref:Uncharacterized protein n=1 Tax=Pleurodeles waltl TaxID=8319 RepID=A0AAV7UFX6_PLEWA|nr:hypothetical protein NDU88_004237 [Pleurodeles waltl]